MANIIVRKNGGTAASRVESEPGRWARDLFHWDPFREMLPTLSTFANLEPAVFAPAYEVKEMKDSYVFKADIPGVEEKDVEITLTGNRLTMTGKREAEHEEKGVNYFACERTYGAFTRSFTLPEGIDAEHIQAELKEGVLTVVVPKTPEAQPRKIGLKGLFAKKS
jgi:HSP20 family protein